MQQSKHIVALSVLFTLILSNIDLNRSDYRAWYGLGQVYEMLEMHYYALYYYEHALVYKSLVSTSTLITDPAIGACGKV